MNIYEIAKLANISTSTVSKVINGKDDVSAGTKNRILSIMKENDYKPKISASVHNNIGIFFRTSQGNMFTSSFLNELLAGISEYFFTRDYCLLMMPTDKIPVNRKNFRVFCHKQRMAGGIFLDLSSDDNYIEQIDGVVPLVTINARFQGEQLYSVISDDYSGCTQAVSYLINMGHRRIAFGTSGMNFLSHQMRLQGYKDVLTHNGIDVDSRLIFSTYQSEREFKMVCEKWKSMDIMPSAIIAINDQEALKIMSFLKAWSVKIPQDMSIVGFDNYSFVEHLSPPLTTVRQSLSEVSRQAASILYACITNGNQDIQRQYVLDEELIIRRSVANIRNVMPGQ